MKPWRMAASRLVTDGKQGRQRERAREERGERERDRARVIYLARTDRRDILIILVQTASSA